MEFNDYQHKALKSVAIKGKDISALAHRSLGLAGEAGETANLVKKLIRDKNGIPTDEDIQLIAEKLGDCLYYTAVLAEYFAFDLQEIAERNLLKSDNFRKTHKNFKY